MSEKLKIENVLLSRECDQAEEKRRLFSNSRIICPYTDGVEPSHRLQWEYLEKEMVRADGRSVEQLSRCANGPEMVQAHNSLGVVSAVSVLLKSFHTGLLPQVVADYNSSYGYDIEPYLIADDDKKPEVFIEVFPRTAEGTPSEAYTSALRFSAPLAVMGMMPEHQENNLGYLIFGERNEAGKELMDVLEDWVPLRGCWYLKTGKAISLLLNECAVSVYTSMVASQKRSPVVNAAVSESKDAPGKLHGSIHVVSVT